MNKEAKVPLGVDGVVYYVDKRVWYFIGKCIGYKVENEKLKEEWGKYNIRFDIPTTFNNIFIPGNYKPLIQSYFMITGMGEKYILSIIEENEKLKEEIEVLKKENDKLKSVTPEEYFNEKNLKINTNDYKVFDVFLDKKYIVPKFIMDRYENFLLEINNLENENGLLKERIGKYRNEISPYFEAETFLVCDYGKDYIDKLRRHVYKLENLVSSYEVNNEEIKRLKKKVNRLIKDKKECFINMACICEEQKVNIHVTY